MKNLLKLTAVFALTIFAFTSCSKDDNPVDNDLFVGTYDGSLSYDSGDGTTVNTNDGRVTVTKVGDNYRFSFSDGIPDITGVKFEEENSEYHINVGGDESSYIRINASELIILYSEGSENWGANCTR
ncbi:hypothetical protein [Mesonia sp. K7]|uniref:hypothetical protein n=1 Tax=Mesonia sp. K7 TaxID=2218606 RepID=UPI000DAAA5E7|nr:hypothetical protein [Mesonia sp. K7]PZD79346.1 hypothetical protein DNG35_02345 [Mesonia sp. K7]